MNRNYNENSSFVLTGINYYFAFAVKQMNLNESVEYKIEASHLPHKEIRSRYLHWN